METERPDEAERLAVRDKVMTAWLEQGGKLPYCASCGEFVILVAGKWEADGLNMPDCYDMTARLTCERSEQGHMPA